MRKSKPKARIYKLVGGPYRGYIGNRKVRDFGMDPQAARAWLRDQIEPVQGYGVYVHPETGERAIPGMFWCRNAINGRWFLEDERKPYNCSPASEAYWSA